jgi:FkbM family methyltransferase
MTCVRINDVELLIDLRDEGVGKPLYLYGAYEEAETVFIEKMVRPGMAVVDIGANIGYFTTLAAQKVGPTGRVVALEPDLYNYSLLTRNIEANGLTDVLPIHAALGAAPGTARLFRSRNNYGDHRLYGETRPGWWYGLRRTIARRECVSVPVETLDRVAAEHNLGRVDFIKMDIQGYECWALAGMSRVIRENPGLILLTEFWPDGLARAGTSGTQYLDLLSRHGLTTALLHGDGTEGPVTSEEIFATMARNKFGYVNLVCRKALS